MRAGFATGSAADGVSETAVSGCGFPVMTDLGHGLQVVPIVEQHRIPVVRGPVIDDGRRAAAAGPVILLALAERVAGRYARQSRCQRRA